MNEWWDSVTSWMVRHDLQIDLMTVWCLSVGFAVLATVEALTWWTLRGTHDRTRVGRELKWKKASTAVAAAGVSILYGLTLAVYYANVSLGYWDRLWIRAFVVAGVLGACFHGVRFVRALRTERGRWP